MPLRDKWTRCHRALWFVRAVPRFLHTTQIDVLELDLARVVRAAAEHAGGNHQKARSYAASLLDSPSA